MKEIPAELYADSVILNANVITVDDKKPRAEAIAIKGDRIIKVGTSKEVKNFVGKHTEVMDLTGKTVLPGFIEPHTHFMSCGIRLKQVNLRTPPNMNIADIQRSIKKVVETTPKGGWIICQGIEHTALEEKRWPTRAELDAAAPNNPVHIGYRSGHASVANSMALDLAGINKDTSQPEGGHIDKDPETGEPTGVLRERASRIITRLISIPTLKELKEGIIEAGKEYVKIGITTTHDVSGTERPEIFRAYQEAIEEDKLKVRVYLFQSIDRIRNMGLHTGFGNNRFKLGAMKTGSDGSIQVYSCRFYEPYITTDTKDPTKDPRGIFTRSPELLKRIVLDAHKLGYQVAIHAQGDEGIDVAIDAVENAMNEHPRPDPRHRIEHCQMVTDEGLKRMKKLRMIASFYPHHVWYWGDRHVSEFLGMKRARRNNPMKLAFDQGIITVAHSDTPIALPGDPLFATDPLFGMWCAVNRKTRNGLDLGPELRLSPMNAIKAYTINGAYASFEEDIKGSVTEGKLADLVVLSDSPLTVDPWEIRNIKVEKTIIGGETIYEA